MSGPANANDGTDEHASAAPDAARRSEAVQLTPKQMHVDDLRLGVEMCAELLTSAWDLPDAEILQQIGVYKLVDLLANHTWRVANIAGMDDVIESFP